MSGYQVTVLALTRYGDLVEVLQKEGLALPNLASLPHISVAGAVATGTHGFGDELGCLSTSVAGLEIVGATGELRRIACGVGRVMFEDYLWSRSWSPCRWRFPCRGTR